MGDDPIYSATAEQGLLFVNGKHISPPYHIEATHQTVTVNGVRCITVDTDSVGDTRGRATGKGRPFDRGRRMSSREQLGRGERRFDDEREDDETEDDEYERRGRFFAARNRERRSDIRPQTAVNQAWHLTEVLETDNIAVVFEESSMQVQQIGGGSGEHLFCDALLSDAPGEELTERFIGLAYTEADRQYWLSMLKDLKPEGKLQAEMTMRRDRIAAVEAENNRQIAAISRLDMLSYPLTIVGMLLGAFAFGHMLQWSGRGITSPPGNDKSSEVRRSVVVAVFLMFCMSSLDLIWTILAGQAGAMREVNPLASGYINSPVQLAAFKVVATLTGLGILLAWRQRQQIQLATWWMCLVCVLLTFRWVVFDSMAT